MKGIASMNIIITAKTLSVLSVNYWSTGGAVESTDAILIGY